MSMGGTSVGDLPLLKLVEVLGLAAAGGGFVWWQLRDLKRAQADLRRAREAQVKRDAEKALAAPQGGASRMAAAAGVPEAPEPPQASSIGPPT